MINQFHKACRPLFSLAALITTGIAAAADVTVFSTDFEGPSVPAEFTALAPSDLTPGQDYAG